MVTTIHWSDIVSPPYILHHAQLPCDAYGFIHIPETLQLPWLQQVFFPEANQPHLIELQLNNVNYPLQTHTFWQHIKIIMRHSSLLANLSLYENLLLPTLYHNHPISNERIHEIIHLLDLHEDIHQQAAERSDALHARIALGQCMLYPPKMIIIQDVCTALSLENQASFYALLQTTLKQTGAGLCYISSSEKIILPVRFSHCFMLEKL